MGGQRLSPDEQEARLKEKGCTFRIHERAYRNKPLTPEQEDANKERSRVRVEHVFAHIENAMNGCYVRTIGIARAKAKNRYGKYRLQYLALYVPHAICCSDRISVSGWRKTG